MTTNLKRIMLCGIILSFVGRTKADDEMIQVTSPVEKNTVGVNN